MPSSGWIRLALPRIIEVRVTDDTLSVDLENERTISVPLSWSPRLVYAAPEERQNFCKMKSIAVKDIYAARDIEPGEELTLDYAATAVDQFASQDFWVLDCKCGSANCRGRVTGDFFQLPEELQRRYYPNLPLSIKRRYRARFRALFEREPGFAS